MSPAAVLQVSHSQPSGCSSEHEWSRLEQDEPEQHHAASVSRMIGMP